MKTWRELQIIDVRVIVCDNCKVTRVHQRIGYTVKKGSCELRFHCSFCYREFIENHDFEN